MRNAPGTPQRTVAVLTLETGGCGASAQSIAALHSAQYAAELATRRISFVRSPRQADVVLVSGPLSATAVPAVQRILDLVPEPQVIVAVGDCAINGCFFAGSTAIAVSPSEALDVHIELPGCPPTPTSILNAIVRAAQLLAEDEVEEAADEGEAEIDEAEIDEADEPDELAEAGATEEIDEEADDTETQGKGKK